MANVIPGRRVRPNWSAWLVAGVAMPAVAVAGDETLPPALPPLPPGVVAERVSPVSPVVVPRPNVIEVPPTGPLSTWAPGPTDPAARAHHRPKFLEHKIGSWHWRRLQGRFFGYPEEFVPRPLGASVYDMGRSMTARGAAARLILYRYDFVDGTDRLNDRGRDQLVKAAAQLSASPYPLLIERVPNDPSLGEARRLAVVAELASGPCPVPNDRVLVGAPVAYGLSGADAQIIGANELHRTQLYGPPIPINSNGVNSPTGVTNPVSGSLPNQ